jgi:transposase
MSSDVDTIAPGRRHNRLWPEALKREIVAASYEPGSSVSVVARRYDVNTNQLFAWRKLYRKGDRGRAEPLLLPVTVTAELGPPARPSSSAADTIEIELSGKYRVRIGSGVDGKALRRVLDALERR